MDKLREKINDYVKKAQENYDLPGLGIAIGVGSNSPLSSKNLKIQEVEGYRDQLEDMPLELGDIFHIASVTKLLVSTALLILEDKGLLDIEEKVTKYLPDLVFTDLRYKDITVKHLLSHTAGLTDVDDYRWYKPAVDDEALKNYVASDEVTKPLFLWSPFDNKFMYSNIGYEMLGAIIENVSGENFETFVSKNIFDPLEMTDATLLTFCRTSKGRALDVNKATAEEIKGALDLKALRSEGVCTPHTKDEDNNIIREKYFPYNREHGPSSTLTAPLKDLMKLGEGFLSKKLLKEETYEKAWTRCTFVPNNGEEMCLAWFKREQDGYNLYGHEGSDDGFRASFWICPELDLYIIALSNTTKAPVKKINKELFQLILNNEN